MPRSLSNPGGLAKRLLSLRRRAGFANQRELAEASGVRQSTIADIESGRTVTPRGDTLKRLAHTLGLSIDSLLLQDGAAGSHETAGFVTGRKLEATAGAKSQLLARRVFPDKGDSREAGGQATESLLRLRVVAASASALDIRVDDLLTLDTGGVVGVAHLVAYVASDEPEPWETFHIRWRLATGSGARARRDTRYMGILSSNAPFSTIIHEARGEFRPVGPILDLLRTYPVPAP